MVKTAIKMPQRCGCINSLCSPRVANEVLDDDALESVGFVTIIGKDVDDEVRNQNGIICESKTS